MMHTCDLSNAAGGAGGPPEFSLSCISVILSQNAYGILAKKMICSWNLIRALSLVVCQNPQCVHS